MTSSIRVFHYRASLPPSDKHDKRSRDPVIEEPRRTHGMTLHPGRRFSLKGFYIDYRVVSLLFFEVAKITAVAKITRTRR
jgi:hypothetical protein